MWLSTEDEQVLRDLIEDWKRRHQLVATTEQFFTNDGTYDEDPQQGGDGE